MKITVIGSHLCPDTLYALNQLAAGAEVSFQDILPCHAALLTYLNIRRTASCTPPSGAPRDWAFPAFSGRTAA